MNPISEVLDKTHDLLGHSPHPAIVWLPLGGFTISNICDGLALATGEESYDDAARYSMAIGLAGAAASVLTGLNDYSHIPTDRPSHAVATTHGLGNAVVGSLFTASYILRTRDHMAGRKASLAARLLGMAGGALSIYTAWLGGVLVENMGEAVEPYQKELSGHDGPHGRERLSAESPLGGRRS